MPSPGHFVLHARCVPPLTAGTYRLHGEQAISNGGATAPLDTDIVVTSPRFRMPPDQILSVFPPANAEGAFEARLPQVVIKRRTLPWERNPFKASETSDPEVPWLALVVVAEGEAELSDEVPVADCVTPGVTLTGQQDVATGIYLNVPHATLTKIFPTQQDLPLLVHCREVDLDDTELAMGDDDGFLAVVLANRLPQYDRVNCKPVRYLACLVNLEQQLDVLPPPSTPAVVFDPGVVVYVASETVADTAVHPDHYAMGIGRPVTKLAELNETVGAAGAAGAALSSSSVGKAFAKPVVDVPVTGGKQATQTWRTVPSAIEQLAVTASQQTVGRSVRDAMAEGFRLPIGIGTFDPIRRFPVLAHWSFTVTGAGSFQSLMEGLDVGMLGTLPADASERPRPVCEAPPAGDAPPATAAPRPALEIAETGHVGLAHTTRRGDGVRAWYRGPLTPFVTLRDQPGDAGRLPLAHVSDQLRRVVPDGREDLALAAAFEIGRLLALARPSVITALMQWRQEQFGAARAAALAGRAAAGIGIIGGLLDGARPADIGALVGRGLALATGQSLDQLAPLRPAVDPARPIAYLQDGDLDAIIANGFAISLADVVERAQKVGVAAALQATVAPVVDASFDPDAISIGRLRSGLVQTVDTLTSGTVQKAPVGAGRRRARGGTEVPARGSRRRDALDRLLDDTAAARDRDGRQGGGA